MKSFLAFLLLTCSLFACKFKSGSGDLIKDTRSLESFSGIQTSNGFEVELRTGNPQQVVIEADDNLMPFIVTKVRGGTLYIGVKENTRVSNAHLKAWVTAPGIDQLQASSGAEIKVINGLRSNGKVTLDCSSGGTIESAIDAPEISGEASSSGKLVLTGRTRNSNFSASSGSAIEAMGLLSENTDVTASSGASAEIFASVKLDAKASSGADIKYKGEAGVAIKQSSGGSVSKQ